MTRITVSRLSGKFSRPNAPARVVLSLARLFTRNSSPNFVVEWDCTALHEHDGLPDRIGPYQIEARLPESMLEAFRLNPFAMRPDPHQGSQLYQALFSNEDARRAAQRLFNAKDTERQLIISTRSDTFPLLSDVPWEFLTPSVESHPLGIDPRLSLVRTLEISKKGVTLATGGPLRIAHILCNDRKVSAFDEEACAIHKAFSELYSRLRPAIRGESIGEPDVVPSLDETAERLGRFSPHVLFFIGHGRAAGGRTELRFTDWEPIDRIVTKAINSCGDLALVLVVACNTAHTEEGWKGSLPASKMGVPAFLESGPAAICAMQAAFSAHYAVPFVELFLRSMFRETSLPAAFSHARRQTHLQNVFLSSAGWAVPLLFINTQNLDGALDLRDSLEAYKLEVERQAASFPVPVKPYTRRAAIDDWLDAALNRATGLAIIDAEESCGSTTSLAAAALRRWQHTQRVLDGVSDEALPRPFFYVDASMGGSPGLSRLLGFFGTEARRLIAARQEGVSEALLGQEINSLPELARFIDTAHACLVIDHVWALDQPARDELAAAASYLKQGAMLLVSRPGVVAQSATQRTSMVRFSSEECEAFAVAHDRASQVGVRWWKISEGKAQRLRLLASGLLAAVADDVVAPLPPGQDDKEILQQIETLWPEVLSLARYCACFPQGLCRRWFVSLGLPGDSVLDAGIGLGILTECTLEEMPWIRVSYRYRRRFFEQKGIEDGGWLDAAVKSLQLVRRLMPADELLGAPTLVRRQLSIIQTYKSIAELFLLFGDLVRGADIARAIYQAERPIGRHLANEGLMMTVLGIIPMAKWEAGDLLRLSVSAQALGHTRLHGSVLDYLESAALEMTPLEEITFLNQQANHLKDTAQSDAIRAIRDLYRQALEIADRKTARADTDENSRCDFSEQSAIILHNWGVAERYIGDPAEALDLLVRARDTYTKLGNPVRAANAAVERAAAELDLPNRTPGWEALEQELVRQAEVLEKEEAIADLAFARYQLARLYKKRTPRDAHRAAQMYLTAAEAASRIGNFRLEGAALKHHALLAGELGLLGAEERLAGLHKATVLLEDPAGDAWATRVRRDAWTAIASLVKESRPDEARHAWCQGVGAAIAPPLRVDRPGTDRRRLGALFSERFDGLIEPSFIDHACELALPGGIGSASGLEALRNLDRN
jgi:hypothetical protein